MKTYNRRKFLKGSALTAAAATTPCWLPSLTRSANVISQQTSDDPFFGQAKNHMDVIAHRGGDGQWPGETMFAYRESMKIGVDVLEMDVYLTKDGQLALMHDKNIAKTTDGKGSIHEFSLAQLQELSAAYNWSKDGSKTFYHKKLKELPAGVPKENLRVASLKEVFEAFPQMRMVIEMKPADLSPAPALCKMIREYKMTDKVLVASFSAAYMTEFRSVCDEVATSTSLSLGDLKKFLTSSSKNKSTGASAIEVPYQIVTESFVNKVKERRLKLHAWTVNHPVDMNRMIALGVDGIITDYPGALLALLNRIQPKPN